MLITTQEDNEALCVFCHILDSVLRGKMTGHDLIILSLARNRMDCDENITQHDSESVQLKELLNYTE